MNNSTHPKDQTLNDSTLTSFDHLIINANLATFSAQYGFDIDGDNQNKSIPYGQLENAAIGIKDGKIAWIGDHEQIMPLLTHYQCQSCDLFSAIWI